MAKMDIETFKTQFDGGTRPNRFEVDIQLPPGVGSGSLNNILVKAASIPAETLGILQIPFRGRVTKLPGDRAYAEWTFTVIDDTTHILRHDLIDWHRAFNKHFDNVPVSDQTYGGGTANILGGGSQWYTSCTVKQLSMTGAPHTCVGMANCWPVEVGAIDLSYDTADTATEFACTIAYDYLTPCASGDDNSGDASSDGDVGTDDSDTYTNGIPDS
jgi:hypothetical protein